MTLTLIRSNNKFKFMTRGIAGPAGEDGRDAPVEGSGFHDRPGDAPFFFTRDVSGGDPDMVDALTADSWTFDDDGLVIRVTGDDRIATRYLSAIEPGRTYLARFAFRRRTNPVDPSGAAVRIGIIWYDQARNLLGGGTATSVIEDIVDVTTGSGRITREQLISRDGGVDVLVPPATARYARAFIQTFDTNHVTDIEVIGFYDVSDLNLYAPDVSVFDGRVTALETIDAGDRLDVLETEVGTPVTRRFATRADAIAATMGASYDAIETQGFASAGDGGGAIYRRVASAPAHPAKFQSADGAWWVDTRQPYVIFASGQSNFAIVHAAEWTPPSNLYVWNFDGQTMASDVVGTGFGVPDDATITVPIAYAARFARENRDRLVCVVSVSRGGMSIENWGGTPPEYFFLEAIANNVSTALSHVERGYIDEMLWWQGESNATALAGAGTPNYVTQYNALIAWMQLLPWFQENTSQLLFGLTPHNELIGAYSGMVQGAAAFDPDRRAWANMAVLPLEYWDPEGAIPNLHLNAIGAFAAGEIAYEAMHKGVGFKPVRGAVYSDQFGGWAYGTDAEGNPFYPRDTVQYKWRQDKPTPLRYQIWNMDETAGAGVDFGLFSTRGNFSVSMIEGGVAQVAWQGAGTMLVSATAADGGWLFNVGGFNPALQMDADRSVVFFPPLNKALGVDRSMTVVMPNDTTLEFRARGSDGVTRTATITLA